MTTIKELRRLLGVTQQQLADYLSVTRTQLSMAEIHHRQLPTAAVQKLIAMERHLTGNASPLVATQMERQTAATGKMLAARALTHERLAAITAHKLKIMQEHHERCVKMLRVTSGLLAELPRGAAAKKDRLWLEILQEDSLKKMNDCGMKAQAVLKLQMSVFSHHAKEARRMMK